MYVKNFKFDFSHVCTDYKAAQTRPPPEVLLLAHLTKEVNVVHVDVKGGINLELDLPAVVLARRGRNVDWLCQKDSGHI